MITITSLLIIFIIIASVTVNARDSVCAVKGQITENNTELLLTYVVWRHGARAPVVEQTFLHYDPALLADLTQPYGYGQLTEDGKLQGYQIGQYLRNRYGYFLSEKFNSSAVYFRSTDTDRTKMTGLTAMAGLYPPLENHWHPNLAWEPVPYTTAPSEIDYMASAASSCPRFMTYFNTILTPRPNNVSFTGELYELYSPVINALTLNIGANFSSNPLAAYMLFDTYNSALGLGVPLPPWLEEVWSDLNTFIDEITKIIFTQEEALRLLSGVIFNNFLTDAQDIIANSDDATSQRVKFFSAHDYNVAGMLAASRVLSGFSHYSATFALELRKVIATGEYVVLPVYTPSVNSEVQYLQVNGCNDLFCNFQKFVELTSAVAIDEAAWKEECVKGEPLLIPH